MRFNKIPVPSDYTSISTTLRSGSSFSFTGPLQRQKFHMQWPSVLVVGVIATNVCRPSSTFGCKHKGAKINMSVNRSHPTARSGFPAGAAISQKIRIFMPSPFFPFFTTKHSAFIHLPTSPLCFHRHRCVNLSFDHRVQSVFCQILEKYLPIPLVCLSVSHAQSRKLKQVPNKRKKKMVGKSFPTFPHLISH